MVIFNNPRRIATTATTSATLTRGSHTPVDATSGAKTMTLPTNAPVGTEISVEKVDASANAVTISGTIRGATSTIPLTTQFEARTFLSEGSGSWRPLSDHRTAAALTKTVTATSVSDSALIGLAAKREQLVAEIRRGKMGKIGTSGKALVTLRFDHKLDPFISTVLPLLQARNLPFSIGVVTKSVANPTAPYEPTTATWADIESKIVTVGGEIWAHSQTHSDGVTQYNGTSLYDEIVTSKSDIETNLPNIRVMGWQQPGSPSTYGTPHTNATAMDDLAGRLIRQTYGLYESSLDGTTRRVLPSSGCCGDNHVTIEAMTTAVIQGVIDEVISQKIGVELMLHADNIGQAGFLSVANLTTVLDYLVTKRDAGLLEVVTASALAFADPGSTYWPSLIPGGDFESATTGSVPASFAINGATPTAAWVINSDGGHSGSKYLHIPVGQTLVTCTAHIGEYGGDGHAFMFEGWIRSTDATPATGRVSILSASKYGGGANVTARGVSGIATSSAWQRVRVPVVMRKGFADAYISFGAQSGTGTVDWDDVSFKPI